MFLFLKVQTQKIKMNIAKNQSGEKNQQLRAITILTQEHSQQKIKRCWETHRPWTNNNTNQKEDETQKPTAKSEIVFKPHRNQAEFRVAQYILFLFNTIPLHCSKCGWHSVSITQLLVVASAKPLTSNRLWKMVLKQLDSPQQPWWRVPQCPAPPKSYQQRICLPILWYENSAPLLQDQANSKMQFTLQRSSWDQIKTIWHLNPHLHLAFSPALSCFPQSLTDSSCQSHPSNSLYEHPCLRLCSWGTEPKAPTSSVLSLCCRLLHQHFSSPRVQTRRAKAILYGPIKPKAILTPLSHSPYFLFY